MLLALNLLLCLFLLCVFGVLDDPLRELSMRPAAGSLLCMVTAGLLFLEDVPFTDALYANIGGFFVPVMGAIALCAAAKKGTRRYLLIMSAFIGIGAWMFNQLTFRALEALQENTVLLQGLFCLIFANLLDSSAKPVLMMSIVGFQLCDLLGYFTAIVSGQSAYVVLGDGLKAVVMIAFVVGSVVICRIRAKVRLAFIKYAGHRTTRNAQPESP